MEGMEKIIDMQKLSERIYAFIFKYADVSPNWGDKEYSGDKYTSPDAYQLLDCADTLASGLKPDRCNSSWEGCGYKPYSSKEGREEHDFLVTEIFKIINEK